MDWKLQVAIAVILNQMFLWGGAYLFHLSEDAWWNFPIFFSCALGFFVTLVFIVYTPLEGG
jgi:hypothetical protein